MKRKKKQVASKPSLGEQFKAMPANKKRRLFLTSAIGVAGLGVGAVALSSYDKQQKLLHDLTVIGEGAPVVVQVHDPSCPTCRKLKSRVSKVLEDFPHLQYRLADLTKKDGRALASKYRAQKVTLLMFDGKGRHVNTQVGLLEPDQLKSLFLREFPAPS